MKSKTPPQTPEKLLIDMYQHIDQARNKLDQFINSIGSKPIFVHHLPDDVQLLIKITLQLPPEKRKVLRKFIESLQTNDQADG